ncbi:unnamed protein product [Prorocentrum cordatum]|uniref:Uncharacterized protein n=1 Tax=Prorocentrum cordatum TaxID=2364126 RepID=A0ABN9XBQ4_9DINO|nr:unnamed protein product [Polarella glacialis]
MGNTQHACHIVPKSSQSECWKCTECGCQCNEARWSWCTNYETSLATAAFGRSWRDQQGPYDAWGHGAPAHWPGFQLEAGAGGGSFVYGVPLALNPGPQLVGGSGAGPTASPPSAQLGGKGCVATGTGTGAQSQFGVSDLPWLKQLASTFEAFGDEQQLYYGSIIASLEVAEIPPPRPTVGMFKHVCEQA